MKAKFIAVIAAAMLAMAPASGMLASASSQRKPAAKAKTTATTTARKAVKSNGTPTLTAKGLGPIRIGMKRTAIPASHPGLYTSIKYVKKDPNEMDIPLDRAGYVDFKRNGQTVITATIMTNGTVGGIEVFDSKIKSPDGIAVGASAAAVKKIPGAVYESDLGTYTAKGITYWVDPDVTKIVAGESLYPY